VSRKGWKGVERTAADLFGLTRYPANMGGKLDFGPKNENEPPFVGQVKNPRVLSLSAVTKLAEEMDAVADSKYGCASDGAGVFLIPGREHYGVTVVKLSNKRPTPHLIVFTEDAWLKLRALLPFDWEVGARQKGGTNGGEDQQESTDGIGAEAEGEDRS